MNLDAIGRFQQLYHQLNKHDTDRALLEVVYSNDIEFRDPFHHIEGLDNLSRYFKEMYANVEDIRFDFGSAWQHEHLQNAQYQSQQQSFIRWQMSYRHPKINAGKTVTVDGGSELIWRDDKVIFHRDFFDAGQMLYEHLPVMGWAIRKLKERMA